jgi:hypothetical protein
MPVRKLYQARCNVCGWYGTPVRLKANAKRDLQLHSGVCVPPSPLHRVEHPTAMRELSDARYSKGVRRRSP